MCVSVQMLSSAEMSAFNLLNCTIKTFPSNLSDFTDGPVRVPMTESSYGKVNVFGLGTLTGISIALFIDVLSVLCQSGASSWQLKVPKINAKTVTTTVALTLLALLVPLVIVFLVLALLYKVVCSVLIKRKDTHFVGFLDSFDVFWSLENDATKSVINVLGVIQSDSPFAVAANIREKLQQIVPNRSTQKIFYRRNEEYGFYYWRRYSLIDMNEYVEIVDLPNRECLDVIDLETLMVDLQNQSLPYNDEGLFKILITRQRIGNRGQDAAEFGIIFRVHHSIGDGVALIEFLCKTFADEEISGFSANMFSFPENGRKDSPHSILDMIYKLCEMPLCFIEGVLRKPDVNALHKRSLLGKPVFKWTQSDENLLVMVKEIKDNVDGMNFSDVLMAALSNGLEYFFTKTMETIPEEIAVVLPVRFPKTLIDEDLVLKNDFSVTILDLPINRGNVNEIKHRCNNLRKSADPLTNYHFLKLVSSVLPNHILQLLLQSNQATMVFSNMPGPDTLTICGGKKLKSMVFFVPLKGNTGLGVTALCYGGVLRFAAVADAALLPRSEDLTLILDGMVEGIKRLHASCVK